MEHQAYEVQMIRKGEMSNSKDGILGWKSTIEGAAKVASISIVQEPMRPQEKCDRVIKHATSLKSPNCLEPFDPT